MGAARQKGPQVEYRCPKIHVATHFSGEKNLGLHGFYSYAWKFLTAQMCHIRGAIFGIYGPYVEKVSPRRRGRFLRCLKDFGGEAVRAGMLQNRTNHRQCSDQWHEASFPDRYILLDRWLWR